METLDDIISDLKTIANENNYEGATVDALIYLMASGIYKNQLNCINTALEISPSSCTLVNSAIQHAQDKLYSVYRGKNQHILLKYALSNEDKTVKKYDICTKIGKYKLLYAKDYTFESNTRFNGTIDLVLCQELIEETLVSSLSKYTRSSSIDLTEDLDLYINGEAATYAKQVDITLGDNNYVNGTLNTPYLILTDTDYGIICWCHDKSNPSLVFDTNYTYSIKSPKYTEETIDPSVIKAIPGFDISTTIEQEDGITSVANMLRDTNVSNIFIEASTAQHSGNIIRSVSDIKDIFLNYFSIQNIRSCKVIFTEDDNAINIVYLLNDKTKSLDESAVKTFKDYLETAYYVNQTINIVKAWSLAEESDEPFKYSDVAKDDITVSLLYSTDTDNELKSFTVKEGDYIELPFEEFTKEGYTFYGWKEISDLSDSYALTGKSIPAKYYPTSNVTLVMVWKNSNTNYKTLDLYTDSLSTGLIDESSFYTRIVIFEDKDNQNHFTLKYNPAIPPKDNYSFSIWVNRSLGTKVNSFYQMDILSDMQFAASWNSITYTVTFKHTETLLENYPNLEDITTSQIVTSGSMISEPDIPETVKSSDTRDFVRSGWYVKEDNEYKKFDLGTPVKQDLILYAKYQNEYDFDILIYFDSPLNNTEIHNFIEKYSYEIGETFSPLRIISQLSKNFEGISWIDLNSSKSEVNVKHDSYFDFSYKVEFNNTTNI